MTVAPDRTPPADPRPTWLAVEITSPTPRALVAQVRGELDMSSAPALEQVLSTVLMESSPRRLVLDMSELRFLGSHGIAVLIRLHNTTTAAGPTALRLAGLRPAVARVLTLTGVLALFDVHDSVESAVADADAPSGRRAPPG
jgi:anti-sigma B factor antagonist